jgi:hypothetical protein
MKKIYLLFVILIVTNLSFAQKLNEVRASMGIDFVNVPSLQLYLESNFTGPLSDFGSAVNFSVSYGRMISQKDQLEGEFSYFLNSFNSTLDYGTYNLSYSILMPSAIYNYVISGPGYSLKFGGGLGPRFLWATENLPADPTDYKYTSLGYGFILRAAGNTAISEDFFAYISADMRYDEIKEPATTPADNVIGNVNFNTLSFGVRLGVSYQF